MSDILKPELIRIEGRCYRVNDPTTEVSALQEHDMYENEITFEEPEDDEEDFEVVMVNNSRYTTSFHVSSHYFGSIIGKKGVTKMRIERDTKTEIKIPRHGQTTDIVIYGPTPASVKAARRRINIMILSSRMKQTKTHFISIPMNTPNIMSTFEQFKKIVLSHVSNSKGVEESVFIRPSKLHITVGLMCLMDNEERLLASKILTDAKEKVIMPVLQGHLPLKIRLKGLAYMNDDPTQIHVLYGRVQEEGNNSAGVLQMLVDKIVEYFNKAGLMEKEYDRENVKLHVTLMNSKYRTSNTTREAFDGSEILKKFSDYDFGVMELTNIHLSQRHSFDLEGYYQPTCVVSITSP